MRVSIFLTSVVFIVSVGHGEFGHLGGLIDIPTATPPENNFLSVIPSGSFALGDDPHSLSMDMTFSFSIAKRGEITLSALTLKDYSLNAKVSFLEEKEVTPALAIGIDNITYNQWTSSVGSGNETGFSDDVRYGGERPKEAFSAFLVATKNIENLGLPFSTTIGIGRGKFVGRGPYSKYTNSDMLFDSNHYAAVGLFGGVALKFTPNLVAMVEYDGRDGNVGLRYELQNFAFNIAFTHLEQLRSDDINSRIDLGFALKSSILAPPKKGLIAGTVFDLYSKTSIDASIAFSDPKLNSVMVRGNYKIAIPSGIHKLRVTSKGYYGKKFKVNIRPDREVKLDIPMLNIVKNDSLNLHMRLGEAFMNEGRILLARDEFARVLKIYPEHPEAEKYRHELAQKITQLISKHKKLAIDYSSKGLLEKAIFEWKEVLKLDPTNREATDSIAVIQSRLEELAKSQSRIKTKPKPPKKPKQPKGTKLTVAEIEAMYKKALVHYYNEDYGKALEILEKIIKADPGHTKAKKYLERTKKILGL